MKLLNTMWHIISGTYVLYIYQAIGQFLKQLAWITALRCCLGLTQFSVCDNKYLMNMKNSIPKPLI